MQMHDSQASGLSKKLAPDFQVKDFDSSMHATEAQLPRGLCCAHSAVGCQQPLQWMPQALLATRS